MEWMKQRDLLIAETMEFVQSVTGRKPGQPGLGPPAGAKPGAVAAAAEGAKTPAKIPAGEILNSPSTIQPGVRLPRAIVGGDVRTEIETRLATFRAHQERFHREREAYFSATLAKARAAFAAGSGSRDRASPSSER
jgi:hypothetical protein